MLLKHLMPRVHLLGVSMSIAAGRTAVAQTAAEAPAATPAYCSVNDATGHFAIDDATMDAAISRTGSIAVLAVAHVSD